MTLRCSSPILEALARTYEAALAGRTGHGDRDVQPLFDELVTEAACCEGDGYELALHQLKEARRAGVIELEYDNPRARTRIHKVRLAPSNEEAFYGYLGRESPSARRGGWAGFFREAATWQVPLGFEQDWKSFCLTQAEAAVTWRDMRPFKREDLASGRKLLALTARLLAWDGGEQLVRWVSSLLCNSSKQLERQQGMLENLLRRATAGRISSFVEIGILPIEPNVRFHGPIKLKFDGTWHDYGVLHGNTTLSVADIERVEEVICTSRRCLTVENKTPFVELSRRQSGELLIWTSYANKATLAFLRLLGECSNRSSPPEFWHFGDTDPSGFDILHDLRIRSGFQFRALHMRYRSRINSRAITSMERARVTVLSESMPNERNELEAILQANEVGDFEQESLGIPPLQNWPFY